MPQTLGFLDTSLLVPAGRFPAAPEVMVVLDVASPDRLGELGAAAAKAGTLVVVDHHVTNEGFGDVAVIDPKAAASAELVYHLIESLGWPIDQTVALCLLAGIVTDTGRFQYSSTDGEVMRVAARLLDAGVRPEVIGQAVYESVPFGYLQASSAVLGRARLEEPLSLVWSVRTHADLKSASVGLEDLDVLIDDLRIAQEAGVTVLLKEVDGGWKVSCAPAARSTSERSPSAHGGGGHHNAAGFTAPAPSKRSWLRYGSSSVADGFLLVDKPGGWTSHDVVARCRRLLGRVGAWATPGRSTRWPPACSCSAWGERPACCASSSRPPRPTRPRRCSAWPPTLSTPTARSCGANRWT